MQETFKVASYDVTWLCWPLYGIHFLATVQGEKLRFFFSCKDTIMMRTKQKAMQNHIKKMQLLFEEAGNIFRPVPRPTCRIFFIIIN